MILIGSFLGKYILLLLLENFRIIIRNLLRMLNI